MTARHRIAATMMPAFAGIRACAQGESVTNLDPRGGS